MPELGLGKKICELVPQRPQNISDWIIVVQSFKTQEEHKRDKCASEAPRAPDRLTEVFIVIADLQVSAKVMGSDLTAR